MEAARRAAGGGEVHHPRHGEGGHVAGGREGAASGAAGPPAEHGTELSGSWTPVIPVLCNGGRQPGHVCYIATPGWGFAFAGEGRPHQIVATSEW